MKLAFVFDVKLTKYKNNYYAVNLSENLWKEKYLPYFDDIKVICRYIETDEDPSNRMHKTNMDHVEVCAMENKNILKRIIHLHSENQQIDKLIKDCDVVISRSFWGVLQAKKNNMPYMIEVVSCMKDALWNHSLKGKISTIPMVFAMKKAVKNAPFVMYVTEQFLQNRYPSHGETIGVSDVITNPINKSELQKRYDRIDNLKTCDTIKIGTAAAIDVKYKGQRFVIKALALLKKKGITNIEYHLAGRGNPVELKKLAEKYDVLDQVIFHGSLKHKDIIKFFDNIDIYVQPSLQEGLPRAVVEAMSRGCPCIAAKTGGCPELLLPNMICSRKNMPADIVDKILYLLKDDNMKISSQHSIKRSADFKKEILDKKREDFMKKFLEYCKI